jgi:hypothetical protein
MHYTRRKTGKPMRAGRKCLPNTDNPFHPDNLRMDTGEVRVVTPVKIKRRREHFIKVPMTWYERLKGAHGQTYRVAWYLLYLHWKNNGEPIKLANGMLAMDGVPRESKRRALRNLECRGLVTVDWRSKKSPIVRVLV